MNSQNLDEQISFFHYNNKNLFSNYYLDNYLKRYPEWNEDEKIKPIFKKVKQIYSRNKSLLTKYNEPQLEKHYIQPIMKVLGHYFEVQEATYRTPKRPDHAFFVNEDNRKEALKNKGKEDFYKRAISVGDAKAWDIPLDRKFRGKKAYTSENPSLQIDIYLRETPPEWGILTNGKLWRIYYEKTSHKLDSYYEVNLQNIILKNDLEEFKYFYLFFRREAFIPDTTGKTFLDHVYNQSIEYAKELGEELKENIYEALKLMAQGFLDWKKNDLKANPETLETIRQNSLIFLYRLLFIFYAESRGLLPKEHHYSLDSIKKEIADIARKGERTPSYTSDYWRRLKEFFDLVNEGSESRGIPKKELYIPAYNGGLFDPNQHKFLEDNCLGDYYCAKVIDLLARAGKNEKGSAFIDYSTLAIRHLGSIYEGLLENRLKIAKEDLVAIKEKRREFWVPASETKNSNYIRRGEKLVYKNKNYKIADIAIKDSVYLVTDRGERKATGSYYTPDYIVEYIVKNTLSPIIEEKKKSKKDLVNEILDIKVLDPAMGSGHFLVEATDFLARTLVAALGEKGKQLEEDEIRWARREVVERCIFGIDLNPLAVELAKLSLWLSTVSTDKALSFLDHHLKCGNSLIGAEIEELGQLPDLKNHAKKEARTMGILEPEFVKKVKDFLNVFEKIESIPSDTAEQVKEKSRLYNEEFEKKSIPFKNIANLWLSNYFGNIVPGTEYSNLQLALSDENSNHWREYSKEKWFKKAVELSKEKHYFHWELEFPEVFFEIGKKKENSGFDAVIGNPPWGYEINKEDRNYLKQIYSKIIVRMIDSYMYFVKKALELSRLKGYIGMIIPNPFLSQVDVKKLRKYLIYSTRITHLLNLGDGVFGVDLANPSCVFISQKISLDKIERDHTILLSDIREVKATYKEEIVSANKMPVKRIKQNFYKKTHNYSLITKGFETNILIQKLKEISFSLKDHLSEKIQRGISADYSKAFIVSEKEIKNKRLEEKIIKPIITGHNVFRFGVEYLNEYILFLTRDNDINKYSNIRKHLEGFKEKITCKEVKEGKHPWFSLHRPRDPEIFKAPKIVGLTTSDRLILGFDTDGYFALDNLYVLHLKSKDIRTYYWILSILNSFLISYIYRFYAQEKGRVLPQVKAKNLYDLPVRRIYFVTPSNVRKNLFDEAINKYSNYFKNNDPPEIINFINFRLMKKYKPDSELVNKHNADPLNKDFLIPKGASWEQSDVVHDFLAFLAEQMIQLNKERQEETKSLLNWMESQLKIRIDNKGNTGIEALSGKSLIKNYLGDYQKNENHLSFEKFWNILEKNKNRINSNLKSRELFENIKSEYEKSLSILLPIKEKLRRTDWLIDQIVYKLYGLSDDEIKLVEESFPSEK